MRDAAKKLAVLLHRSEFLALAKDGRKWVAPGLILQAGKSPQSADNATIRYGLTASRMVGNAVLRNRARRRLRALAHEILPAHAAPAHDYVLIARAATAMRKPADLRQDLITALHKLKVWTEQ